MKSTQIIPTEEEDQKILAEVLDRIGVLWFHPPNEGKRKPQYAAKMAQLGLKPGVPDVIIFDPPPKFPEFKGAVLELKRKKGGRVSEHQVYWIRELAKRHWAFAIRYGIDDALEALRGWGYLK